MASSIKLADLEYRVLLLSKAVEEDTEGLKEAQRDPMEYKTQNDWSLQGVREDNNKTRLDFAAQNAQNNETFAKFKTILRDFQDYKTRSEARIQELEELNRQSERTLRYVTEQLQGVVAWNMSMETRGRRE